MSIYKAGTSITVAADVLQQIGYVVLTQDRYVKWVRALLVGMAWHGMAWRDAMYTLFPMIASRLKRIKTIMIYVQLLYLYY